MRCLILGVVLPFVASMPATFEPVRMLSAVELAQFDFEPWSLTEVSLDCSRQSVDSQFSCDYKFHWYYPNFDESVDCNDNFNWDGITLENGPRNGYSLENVVCGVDLPEYWQFRFNSVRSLWDFNMTVSMKHWDSKDFGHYIPQFFSWPNVTMDLVGDTAFTKVYATSGPLEAKITGMTL